MNQIASDWKDYEVLDAGNKEKLERWNDVILRRPDPVALWPIDDESNWFLPSSGQMLLMYRYRDKINEMMRTFWSSDSMLMTDKYYWSSTIWDNNSAWTFELNTGRFTVQNKNSVLLHVRAIASE